MNGPNIVQIMDRAGWRKEFPLQKNLVHIGSAPQNDIVLDAQRGDGVSSRHLQLIAVPGDAQRYRAVNLGNEDILLGKAENRSIAPRSMVEITHGERLRLGDFTLLFRLGMSRAPTAPRAAAPAVAVTPAVTTPIVGADETSPVIGLRLSLPSPVLELDRPLEGLVTVRNLGNEPGVQFKLEVQGLGPSAARSGQARSCFPTSKRGFFWR